MALRFQLLRYVTARHWTVSRGLFAVAGFVMVMGLTGRFVLAADQARLFWADDYKTALHRLDWFAHYGWMGRILRRRPVFDITQDMAPAGIAAVAAMIRAGTDPATLRAQLYIAQAQSDWPAYTRIANQIVADIPAPMDDPDKHAPAFTRAQAAMALDALGQLMGGMGMPWYIVSGTFLGAVRERDFLGHDYDIDIGVHAEHFDHARLITALRASADFCLVRIDDYVDLLGDDLKRVQMPALYKIMHRTGVEVDIFLHHLTGGQRWHGSARHRWWNADFATADYTIGALTVSGPADAHTYLTENYGDWRTPKAAFDCSTGTPNVSFNRNLVSIAQFLAQARAGSATAQTVLTDEGYLRDRRFVLPWLQ